jgi:uncharacterized YigZ family protein
MIKYLTVAGEGVGELVIERSRFIGRVRPVASKEEADAFFAEIRAAHRDATHNVPAFVVGDKMQLQWASDDGEPQGTSGAPIVQMLVEEGLTNVAVIVTRYFGGVKLGTGGLVRAYTSAAKVGLADAGKMAVKEGIALNYVLDYTFFAGLEQMARRGALAVRNAEFAERINANLVFDPEDEERVMTALADLTKGTGTPISKEIVELTEAI